MGKIAKLAFSLGKPISIITLILSCLAVVAGFFIQQQTISQQYQNESKHHQKQVASLLYGATLARIEALKKQVISVSSSPKIISSLKSGQPEIMAEQERELAFLFPDALKAGLIPADVNDLDETTNIPITFATLNSIRLAKKKGLAPIGLMKRGTKNAHLLLAHRVVDDADNILGVLLVTLAPKIIDGLLSKDSDFQGYIELQQASKKVSVLASSGDESEKNGLASAVMKLPNTYWQVAYWYKTKAESSVPSMIILGIVLAILLLMWFLRDAVRCYLFKHDVEILTLQVADLKEGKLKPNYPPIFGVLSVIASDLKTVVISSYQSNMKKGATAESISKKMDKMEVENPVELDLLEEAVDVDSRLFKANDIRGIVGDNLTEGAVKAIGHAIGSEANEQGQNQLVVARDGRLSSESLSKALIEGILASGCDVIDIGEAPTPMMYFACEQMGTNSGVMVTGSHNPPEYNGLKTILAGETIFGEALQKIYQRIQQGDLRSGEGILSEASINDDYIRRVRSDVKLARSVKVVVDCGNGIAGAVAPTLLSELGCEVIELYCEVDGNFPNHHPNPSDPENLQDLAAAVKKHNAELGIAFDGDGDRIGVVDASGNPIWPDRLMMLFAQDVLSRMPGSVVVYDVKCTNMLGEEVSKAGGEAVMTKSGYAFIKSKMQELGAQLGGELSGHIFFKERWFGFDDALYAASRLLELISDDLMQRRATEIFEALPSRESTAEIFVDLDESECTRFIQLLAGDGRFDGADIITIDGVRVEYPDSWGLVRASNTVPGLSLRFEADTAEGLQDIQQKFKQQMLQIKPTLILLF